MCCGGGGGTAGSGAARWQQWLLSATWPGEDEPFSLLLLSQCEMTLARFVGPVWLAAPQSVRPSVWPSVTLTAKAVSRRVSPLSGSSVGAAGGCERNRRKVCGRLHPKHLILHMLSAGLCGNALWSDGSDDTSHRGDAVAGDSEVYFAVKKKRVKGRRDGALGKTGSEMYV